MDNKDYKPMSKSAETLYNKNHNFTDDSDIKERKKALIKGIIKGKTKTVGKNKFDPNPEIDETQTLVKT